jgi:hypothetical protein
VRNAVELANHFRDVAVDDVFAPLLWMDTTAVTMMCTIHPLSCEN